MIMHRLCTALGLFFLLALLWCPPCPGQESTPPTDAPQAFSVAARSLGLQTDLPGPDPSDKTKNREISEPWRLPEDTARILLWAAVLVLMGVALMTLKNSLWSRSRSRPLGGEYSPETAPKATAARMDTAQVEADDLARTGNFAEAMHVLLLQSVSELRRRVDAPIAASLTSREILARTGLPPAAGSAFADIIGRVEVSWFGAHEPGEEDYRACRRSFETLSAVLARGGAA